MSHEGEHGSESVLVGSWLTDTYWYVPALYLPALLANNASEPRIVTVQDQRVWHMTNYSNGFVSGISASNIGFGWSYMPIVGSVAPNRTVKLSFSPRSDPNSPDPSTQSITIGDGTLLGEGANAEFLMQMTTGTPSTSLTHWARMLQVTPADSEWSSLPGCPNTGVPDLTACRHQSYTNSPPTASRHSRCWNLMLIPKPTRALRDRWKRWEGSCCFPAYDDGGREADEITWPDWILRREPRPLDAENAPIPVPVAK